MGNVRRQLPGQRGSVGLQRFRDYDQPTVIVTTNRGETQLLGKMDPATIHWLLNFVFEEDYTRVVDDYELELRY